MFLPEDQKGEAKQVQSLRKPKGKTGSPNFPDFPLSLEITSLPEAPILSYSIVFAEGQRSP